MPKVDRVTLEQLKKDREELVGQMQAMSGAIRYIDNKIASFAQKEAKGDDG